MPFFSLLNGGALMNKLTPQEYWSQIMPPHTSIYDTVYRPIGYPEKRFAKITNVKNHIGPKKDLFDCAGYGSCTISHYSFGLTIESGTGAVAYYNNSKWHPATEYRKSNWGNAHDFNDRKFANSLNFYKVSAEEIVFGKKI
jgi:hypothetical protein